MLVYTCTHTQGEEGMATHYILAWRIPGTEEPGGWGLGGYSPWGRMELDTTEATEHTSICKGLNKKLVQ